VVGVGEFEQFDGRSVGYLIMPIAVSIALFLISDLDSPRGGAILVRPNNLISVSQSLGNSVNWNLSVLSVLPVSRRAARS
jgi:hypothetical protein